MRILRRHISYANVTSTLALVLAAGTGVVYAAGEIGSREIDNNSVRTQDLKDRRGVKGEDTRRNTFGAREVDEGDLVGSRIVRISGDQEASCDPGPASFENCAEVQVELVATSDLLITTTGGFYSAVNNATAVCETRVNDSDEPISDTPGVTANNTGLSAVDGFARTVTKSDVGPGTHTVALACQQLGAQDAQIRAPTISVIAVSSE